MFEDDFAKRLLQLRQQKNVTARDMSLFISQKYCKVKSVYEFSRKRIFHFYKNFLTKNYLNA